MNSINVSEIDLNNSFFHFTSKDNLENIEKEGLKAQIGDASKLKQEKESRIYMSKGGKGILEIKNSFIYEFKKLRVCDIPMEYRKYFNIKDFSNTNQVNENDVYRAMEKRLKDEVYFKIDAVEGEDYEIKDFFPEELASSFRTSNNVRDIKGKENHDIDSKKITLLTTDKGSTSFDIVNYLYNRLLENAKKNGKEKIVREVNSDLDGFFNYVRQKDNNLQSMMNFFEYDINVKNMLNDIMPKEIELQNMDSMVEYTDKRENVCCDIEFYFEKMSDCFPQVSSNKDIIREQLKSFKEKIVASGYTSKDLKDSYEKCFTQMSPDLIKKVNESCKGYYIFRDEEFSSLIKSTTTYNELLHVMHSYVTNNENILKDMPIVEEKKNDQSTYTLYGQENENAKKIFDKIDVENTNMGTTQILAFKNKILMMVRDAGHALSVDIDTSEKDPIVNYFIPKITNVELVNQLRGVRKVDENDSFKNTSGAFEIKDMDNIGIEVIDFIEKVPTDSDMHKEKIETWTENLQNMYEETSEVRNSPKFNLKKIIEKIQRESFGKFKETKEK